MSSVIDKRELEKLAKLARIELDPKEEDRLLNDLGNILDHFKELQALDTSAVLPMTGGTDLHSIFREDGIREDAAAGDENDMHENTNRGAGVEAFPKNEKGFLKIPPVFE